MGPSPAPSPGSCLRASGRWHLLLSAPPESRAWPASPPSPASLSAGLRVGQEGEACGKVIPEERRGGECGHLWETLATSMLGTLYSLPETSDSTVHQSPCLERESREAPLSEESRPWDCSFGVHKDPLRLTPAATCFPPFLAPASPDASWTGWIAGGMSQASLSQRPFPAQCIFRCPGPTDLLREDGQWLS